MKKELKLRRMVWRCTVYYGGRWCGRASTTGDDVAGYIMVGNGFVAGKSYVVGYNGAGYSVIGV